MADVFPRRNLPGGAEPWGRAVQERIVSAEGGIVALRQSTQSQNRSTASSLSQLAAQVATLQAVVDALPVTVTQTFTASGFAYPGVFNPVLTGTIPVPPGKANASIAVIGTLNGTDETSGGLATIYGRAAINGGAFLSPEFPAAKDAAVSRVINVVNVTGSAGLDVRFSDEVDVELQGFATNPSAFPDGATPPNFASVTVIATFT